MSAFGTLLREMRTARRFSQLDFALESEVSAKHISFLETGRSRPSKEMVIHLAAILKADLAATNRLLSAAGFSQLFSRQDLYSAPMAMVREALDHLLTSHLPYPALVFDDQYRVISGNAAQQFLMQQLIRYGARFPSDLNIFLATLDQKGIRPFIENWEQVACHMLQRVYHEHLAGPLRDAPNALLEAALQLPDMPENWKSMHIDNLEMPVIPFTLTLGEQRLSMFSTVASIGTPLDITAQNLRIEHFFPADEVTREFWQDAAAG